MHQKMHRHAARRLYKRDDPPAIDVNVLQLDNSLDKRAPDVATVFSVVYVTASATFSGPTAGFVTLSANPTTTAKAAAKPTASSDDDDDKDHTSTTAKGKQTSTSTSSSSTSSAKSTASSSSHTTSAASTSVSSSSSMATSSTAHATSSAAASSSIASSSIAPSNAKAQVTSSSSATSSASPDSSSGGVNTGAQAAIALVVIAVVGVIAGLAYFMIRKKKAERKAAAGANNTDDEKKGFISQSPSTTNVPQPPPLAHNDAAPRVSYRPGSQFAPNVLGDAEKAAAGAAAGALFNNTNQPASAWERRGTNATNDPSNPFGIHAQTIDGHSKEMISPIPEERSLSPPAELQGSPVPSPTASSFNVASPVTPGANAEVGTASVVSLPAIAAVTPGATSTTAAAADPPNSTVHRVQLEFKPSMDDELELKVGQIVRLLHEYDDGWALCIRMDRSQQGVAPRTCLSKLPLKPRPMGPPPNGAKNGPPRGAPRPGPGMNGPPRPGPGPQGRQPGPPPHGAPASQLVRPAAQPSKASSPTLKSAATNAPQQPQQRQRSMSVSTSKPDLQQNSSSPAERVMEAHRRSISMGSLANANKPANSPVESSSLGVPARKPVPGQAL